MSFGIFVEYTGCESIHARYFTRTSDREIESMDRMFSQLFGRMEFTWSEFVWKKNRFFIRFASYYYRSEDMHALST